MVEEKLERRAGKVEEIRLWQMNKGYFLRLIGDRRDYFAYGSPKCKEEDEVILYVKPGTGNFRDKWQITKVEVMNKGQATLPVQAKTDPELRHRAIVHALAVLTASATAEAEDPEKLAERAIELAKKFEKYISGQ